jgi:hypothetical protein
MAETARLSAQSKTINPVCGLRILKLLIFTIFDFMAFTVWIKAGFGLFGCRLIMETTPNPIAWMQGFARGEIIGMIGFHLGGKTGSIFFLVEQTRQFFIGGFFARLRRRAGGTGRWQISSE